jgi:hypothetical protein
VDSAGIAYVLGDSASDDFPLVHPLQPTRGGGFDATVMKINAAGTAFLYSTYLGGSQDENLNQGGGIAIDVAGNAYITGYTKSSDFPVTAHAFQPTFGGGLDAYVAKINPTGSALVYSSYLGGSSNDAGKAIAVDAAGNAYVTGYTNSTDFPTAGPVQAAHGADGGKADAFVAKVNASGTALVYSTYLGGNDDDKGFGIAVDAAGNAYVTGQTLSTNFPTANPLPPATGSNGYDAFVAELNASGSTLIFSTYLGGNGDDKGFAIALDATGAIYVTGESTSTDFPTVTAWQKANAGHTDAILVKLVPSAGSVQFSAATYAARENASTAAITVTRDGSDGTVTIAYATRDGTAAAGNEYTATSGTLTFAPGQTSKTFSVPILDNKVVEGDQTVNLTLSNPTGGATLGSRSTAVLTIHDDDLPQVANSPPPANLNQAAGLFAHSREHFTEFVVNAYLQYLGRGPDAAGLNAWVTAFTTQGLTDERLEAGFIGAPEYITNHGGRGRGWVIGMYKDLLGRTPAESEVQTWLNALAAGATEAQVAYGFAASPEREGIRVRGDYATFLGRSASDAEVNLWVNLFVTGVTNEDVVTGFVSSPEYYNSPGKGKSNKASWVFSAYTQVLFRSPTVSEVNGWLAFLN